MKIFFFIFGTPFFLAVLYVIRLILDFQLFKEYDKDYTSTSDFVSNLSRRFVIFMMGFLPIALIVQILSYILVYILPYTVYRLLIALAIIISIAMGVIKYRKNSKRFNSLSKKKKWILCCLAFGFLTGLIETQLASIDSPNSTIEIIIGYVSCIAWSIIISGGYKAVIELFLGLIISLITSIFGVFDKIFGGK